PIHSPPMFLSTPRPPSSSTLFPYTTLFRSLRATRELDDPALLKCSRSARVASTSRASVQHVLRPTRFPEGPEFLAPSLVAPPPRSEGTRLNSSHLVISYAVFCLKKKKYTKS